MSSIPIIEDALRQTLPNAPHESITELAQMLDAVVQGRCSVADAQRMIAASPPLIQLAQSLVGQSITTSTSALFFVQGIPATVQSPDPSFILRIVNTGGGDYAEGALDKRRGTFVDLHVHAGDSPEIQQRKQARARQLIVSEVIANITNVDAWLSFTAAALITDTTAARLVTLRQQHAPAIQAAAAAGYMQLMAVQQVATLRQSFNSRPLAIDIGPGLIDLQLTSGADASQLNMFYHLLADLRDGAGVAVDNAGKTSVDQNWR